MNSRQQLQSRVSADATNVFAPLLFFVYLVAIPSALYLLTQGELGLYHFEVPEQWLRLGLLIFHVYVSLRLTAVTFSPDVPWMRYPFFAFLYIWVSVTPPVQFSSQRYPWGVYLGEGPYLYGLLVIACGVIAYDFGAISARRRPAPRARRSMPYFSAKRVQVLSILSCLLVLVLTILIGPSAMLGPRGSSAGAMSELAGGGSQVRLLLTAILRAPSLVAAFALLCLLLTGAWRSIPHFRPLFICVSLFFLLSNFPTAHSRGWVGGVGLGLIAVYALSRKINIYRVIGLPIVLSFLFVFPIFQFRRGQEIDTDRILSPLSYTHGDHDVFQLNAIIVNFARAEGLEWGRQFLGSLFFWVPRSLWESKPVGTGYYVSGEIGMNFNNVSAPLWSEAYINFGLIGTIIFFFLYGSYSRKWEASLASSVFPLRLAVVAAFLSGFQVFILRGDLMTSATFLVPVLLVAYFALKPRAGPHC